MTASLRSGRSRHGSQAVRPRSSAQHRSSKGTVEEVVHTPNAEELRDKRVAYYSTTAAERRKRPSSTTTRRRSKDASEPLSSTKATEHRHRRRKHKSSHSSRTTEATQKIGGPGTDDFVYGAAIVREQEQDNDAKDGMRRSRTTRHASTPRRHDLPTVVESEITPDDSVSQVAERQHSRSHRHNATVRPSLRRSHTTSSKLSSVPGDAIDARHKSLSSAGSPHSLLGSILRRKSVAAVPTLPRLVDCLTCGSDDIPSTQSAKLTCGHRMCHDCLKRVFEMSVKDPAHMPPKCCTDSHIPLKHVDSLFDLKFKVLWNRKYQEYHTKHRIYCPAPKCGEWIKPKHIHKDDHGRKYASCPRCKTKVCTLCNNKMHKARECPKDPEIIKLVAQAKEKGWQTCFSCNAIVELKEGCNHMTCRCTAEFCMTCGAKWKSCDCPWFNYNNLPHPDRLNDMRIPVPIQVLFRQVVGGANGAQPQRAAAAAAQAAVPEYRAAAQAATRRERPTRVNRASTYNEEMEQRERQERLDADLARRLQLASLLEPDNEAPQRRHRAANVETWGLGNAAGHFMNDDFVQNAANVVMSAFGETDMGRRGERASGRRRRTRETQHNLEDSGLAPNFLGDASVLGIRPHGGAS